MESVLNVGALENSNMSKDSSMARIPNDFCSKAHFYEYLTETGKTFHLPICLTPFM